MVFEIKIPTTLEELWKWYGGFKALAAFVPKDSQVLAVFNFFAGGARHFLRSLHRLSTSLKNVPSSFHGSSVISYPRRITDCEAYDLHV